MKRKSEAEKRSYSVTLVAPQAFGFGVLSSAEPIRMRWSKKGKARHECKSLRQATLLDLDASPTLVFIEALKNGQPYYFTTNDNENIYSHCLQLQSSKLPQIIADRLALLEFHQQSLVARFELPKMDSIEIPKSMESELSRLLLAEDGSLKDASAQKFQLRALDLHLQSGREVLLFSSENVKDCLIQMIIKQLKDMNGMTFR